MKKKRKPTRAASAETLRRRLRKSELHLREVKKRYEIAMQALRSQCALTQAIVEQIPGAVFVKDSEGRFTMANRGWSAMSGIPVERALGRTVHDLYPAEVAKRFAAEDEKLLAQGAGAPPIEAVHEGPRPGQFRIVRKAVLSGDDGSAQGLVCTSTDITDLKRAESELADRAKFIGELVDALPVSIALRDTEHRFLQVNRTWERFFNLRREDVLGKRFGDLPGWRENPELLEVAREGEEIDRNIIAGGTGKEPVALQHRRLGRNYLVSRQVFADSAGRLTAVLATGLDITESTAMDEALKRAEREAADRAKFVGELIDALPVSIALRDTEGRFLRVNRTWERYFNLRRDDVLGKRPSELPGWQDNEELVAAGKRALEFDRAAIERGPGAELAPTERERLGHTYLLNQQAFADSAGRTVGVLATGIDITETKTMEAALKRAERDAADRAKMFVELIDALPVSIAMRDTQGRFLQVNRTWERYFNIRREEAIGRRFPELPGWREGEELEAAAKRSIQLDLDAIARGPTAEPVAGEGHRLGRSYVVSRQVFSDSMERMTAVLATGVDITESKAMEAALTQAERNAADRAKFISELVDALPISVAMRDLEGRYVLVNRMWERFFGVKREDAIGRRRRELPGWQADPAHLQDAEEIEQVDREFLARGPEYIPEAEEVRRLGRHYLMTRRVLADSAGTPLGVLSAGMDMTERRAMEEALAAERQRLALVVSATQAGIVDWDTATEMPWYSERFKEMLGYPADFDTSAWASIFGSLMHPEDRDRSREVFFTGLVSQGAPNSIVVQDPLELRLRRADGSWLWVQSMGLTLRDEAGETRRYLAALTDITERRAQEEALRESVRLREEVERMSRHDLKTPLNSVIAMSRLLREGGRVTPEDAELLGTIERAGYRILNMVNLSLDLFRMETGNYQFHPQAVDLAGVACRVAADLESQAASKSIDVRVRANGVSAATQEVLARGDELLCYSMFANLIKNAIEAAPPGGTVSVSLKKENDAVVAEVHNPGAVPEKMRGRFFRKYATTGKSAGLGLGTYSAQLMARVQEGELTLESSEPGGTTLIARLKTAGADLPRAVESRAAASASVAAGAALPPRKVLVVDDDEFNRLVLRRYLPVPPLSVAFAVNGRAALDAAALDWPDVVLLDLEMPVMDGYEAAQRLREVERSQGLKRCLIVAISSNDEESVVQRALAAGCDQYVVKPAPRQVLWRILGGAASEDIPAAAAEAKDSDAVSVDEGLRAVLPEFLRSRKELLEQMPAALAAGDRMLFKRCAHRLAGSFALYGFAWAAAQCRAIEGDALAGYPNDLEQRAAAVRAHLDSVAIEFVPAKGMVSAERL